MGRPSALPIALLLIALLGVAACVALLGSPGAMELATGSQGEATEPIRRSDRVPPAGDATATAPQHDGDPPGEGAPTGAEGTALRAAGPAAITGELRTTNTSGRSGGYYIPAYPTEAMPILVAVHGTGGSGPGMVKSFRALADAHGFAIVAPSSRRSPAGQFTWQVADRAGEVTPDLQHIRACLDEVLQAHRPRLSNAGMLIAGHSGGASTAPYVATNDSPRRFSAFAVLHGGVFASGLGAQRMRGWFSTGEQDRIRPPAAVQAAMGAAQAAGHGDVVYRAYPGGHGLSAQEKRDMIGWWLGPGR